MKNIFLKYLKTLTKTMRYEVSLALIIMLCLSFTEGIGLMLLLPILQLVGVSTQQDSTSNFVEAISSAFKFVHLKPTLIVVLGVYVLIISLNALLNYWQIVTNQSVEHKFVAILQKKLYRAIANSNWLFFARKRASDFTHAITTELVRVGSGTYHLLVLVVNVVISLIYVLLAVKLSVLMTIMVFVCGTGLLLLLKGKMQQARLTGEELSMESKGLYAAAIEHFSSMKTTKSYNAQESNENIFSQVANEVAQINIKIAKRQSEVKCWFDIGAVFVLSLILYISLRFIAISTASLLLLLFLFARIIPKFSNLQQSYQEITHMLPAFANFIELKEQCEKAAEVTIREIEKVEFKHSIKLNNVSFAYEKQNLFYDLNLTIQAFKTTGIVGPSGSGKSTIADLVMGLLIPDRGIVSTDGFPLASSKIKSWRNSIGYVAQDTFLFHDTIRANLLWACPGATDEDINRALKLAACEEFISLLPKGIETIVGDRGILLSGGERQRLALARALLRKPCLLILDEATNSLDSENEKRIQGAIEELKGQITILVITHRLITVKNIDLIYVLEKGQVKEQGNWDTLVNNKIGRFYKFCSAQEVALNLPSKSHSL